MLLLHDHCVLSHLRCNGHSLLLSSYLSRIGRIENPSCSAYGHSSQDISDFILHSPATDSLRRSFFGNFLSLHDLWSRPWGVAWLLGLHGLPPSTHTSKGSDNNNNSKTKIADVLLRSKLANLDVSKVVNRITSQSATCYPKILILFIYMEHHYI